MSKYAFNKKTRRYVRIISPAEQRQMVLRITSKGADKLATLTDQLIAGQISTAEWAVQMKDGIRAIHSTLGQLAHGGKAQMGPKQLGSLGAAIREQNKYLLNFVSEVENGLTLNGTVRNRARMYADAGWVTYEKAIAQREKAAGMRQERSVLEEGASHCEDCPAEASKDWQPLGTLIPVGERQCGPRCRCSTEYR